MKPIEAYGMGGNPSPSSKASTQKSASMVLESRQDRTFRLYQSITATRYKNPLGIGIYVISAAQT